MKINNKGLALKAKIKSKIEDTWMNSQNDQYSFLDDLPTKSILLSIRTIYTFLKKSFILNKLYLNIYLIRYEK